MSRVTLVKELPPKPGDMESLSQEPGGSKKGGAAAGLPQRGGGPFSPGRGRDRPLGEGGGGLSDQHAPSR